MQVLISILAALTIAGGAAWTSVPSTFLRRSSPKMSTSTSRLQGIPRGKSEPQSKYSADEIAALEANIPTVDVSEIDGLVDDTQYMLGDLDGLDDPIDAPWRVEGEEIMRSAGK